MFQNYSREKKKCSKITQGGGWGRGETGIIGPEANSQRFIVSEAPARTWEACLELHANDK